MKNIVYLCGARDFHAMDWYRSTQRNLEGSGINLLLLTDLIEGEGYKKLITSKDNLHKLVILDNFLFKYESKYGNYWRNLIKLVVFPIQIISIFKFNQKFPQSIYHAHSMYYIWLAWAARLEYVATPQGSDILVKPYKSKLYCFFSKLALKSAKNITVDSNLMAKGVFNISGIFPVVIQNGIDLTSLFKYCRVEKPKRDRILSIRGFTNLYCLEEILVSRNNSDQYFNYPISFIYPFVDSTYKHSVLSFFKDIDMDIGRLEKESMYELLQNSFLVVSIPISDSSPRSVYESIFCGCAVAIRYNPFYDDLPECMKSRIILIDFNNKNWFNDAVKTASFIVKNDFVPSKQALYDYDQLNSSKKIIQLLLS